MLTHAALLVGTATAAAASVSEVSFRLDDNDSVYLVDAYRRGTFSRMCFGEAYYLTARLDIDDTQLSAFVDRAEALGFFTWPETLPYDSTRECPNDNPDSTEVDQPCMSVVLVTSHCCHSSLRVSKGAQDNTVQWDCNTAQSSGDTLPMAVQPLVLAIGHLFATQPTVRNAPDKFCGYR